MKTVLTAATLVIVLLPLCSISHADNVVDISTGGSSYFWDPDAPQTSIFDDGLGNVLFEDHFIIRYDDSSGIGGLATFTDSLNGDTAGNVVYQGTTNTGDTADSSWFIIGGSFGPVHIYTVTLTQTISIDRGRTVLDYDWGVENVAGDVGSDFSLFHFFDYDINPFGTNSATAGFDENNDVRIDMTGDDAKTYVLGVEADRFELRAVGNGARLTADILGDNDYNLDFDPTSLTDVDINAAVQWDRTQAGVGGTVSFFGEAAIVPEPCSLVLLSMAGIAGCIVRRRRK